MSLQLVKSGPRRSFEITCGLRPGYGGRANAHPFKRAAGVVVEHLKTCAAAKRPYLPGIILGGEVCYAWREDPRTVEARSEPCVVYRGEVSPLYNADMTDEAALAWLTNLADILAESLSQTRVYVSYRDEIHIFEREGHTSPRKS